MTTEKKFLTSEDFTRIFKEPLSDFVLAKITEANLSYQEISSTERDDCLIKIVNTLSDQFLVYSGAHRHEQWDKGWAENLLDYSEKNDITATKPKYFGKYPINRFEQRFIKALSADFEVNILGILQYWLFDKYLKNYNYIYEFGCGTGHNLLRLRELNSRAELYGLDWAESSQQLIENLRATGIDRNIYAHNFDFFKPDYNFQLKTNSAIFTMAALEQVGDRYKEFVDYLLENKPALCLHIEPIAELLDPEHNLLDCLSVAYFNKRKYLSGYLDYLRSLEDAGKIKILTAERSYIGSFFIDGYSVIAWQVI